MTAVRRSSASWLANPGIHRAEEGFAVAAAVQEDEPLQVGAQFVQAVGGMAGELCQGGAEAAGMGQARFPAGFCRGSGRPSAVLPWVA